MKKHPVFQDVGRTEGKWLPAGHRYCHTHREWDLGFLTRFTPAKDFPLIILLFQIAQTDYSGTEVGSLKHPLALIAGILFWEAFGRAAVVLGFKPELAA